MFIAGNTCRSPIAEAVFIELVKNAGCKRDWEIDSAAIQSWHVGNRPNARAVAVMDNYNLAYDNRARQITDHDFYKFDYIFGMDYYNIEDLNDLKPDDAKAEILLLSDFDPNEEGIIRDPYCVIIIKLLSSIIKVIFCLIFFIGYRFKWLRTMLSTGITLL